MIIEILLGVAVGLLALIAFTLQVGFYGIWERLDQIKASLAKLIGEDNE